MTTCQYTIEKLIGHLVALFEHFENRICEECIVKHKCAAWEYFDELIAYVEDKEKVRQWKKEFLKMDFKRENRYTAIKELHTLYNELIKFRMLLPI